MADNTGKLEMTEDPFPGMADLTVIYIEESDTLKMHNGCPAHVGIDHSQSCTPLS